MANRNLEETVCVARCNHLCTARARGLAAARGFSDFWYKEMDKLFGLIIFTIVFCMSLLPVATMQTVLIWNEAFSDILAKRIGVQDTVSSILD